MRHDTWRFSLPYLFKEATVLKGSPGLIPTITAPKIKLYLFIYSLFFFLKGAQDEFYKVEYSAHYASLKKKQPH